MTESPERNTARGLPEQYRKQNPKNGRGAPGEPPQKDPPIAIAMALQFSPLPLSKLQASNA